jgi:hypothetical protein
MPTPHPAERLRVSIPAGRWGSRRVRVGECATVARAEDVYSRVNDDRGRGAFELEIPGVRSWVIGWELRPNNVWARGRLFLICPRCDTRATRLYAPLSELRPECRRCWGLTYESRARPVNKGVISGGS